MNKKILSAAVGVLALAASCSKKDNNGTSMPANGWRINGNTYTVSEATCPGREFVAVDSFGHRLRVTFAGTPALDKNYLIAVSDTVNFIIGPDEAFVSYNINGRYYYSGNTKSLLNVKMTGGKVNITIPNIWLIGNNTSDSLLVSAHLVQTK